MSAICTREEIAEKKRIAEQKLRQKLAVKKKNSEHNNVIQKNVLNKNSYNNISAKPAATFYDKQSSNFQKPLNNLSNKPNSIQAQQNSYAKFISSFAKEKTVQNEVEKVAEKFSPVRKSFPVFEQKIRCEVSMVTENRFVVKPSKYHEQLISIFKTIPSKQYDNNTRLWTFSISDYETLQKRAENLISAVILDQIPKQVLDLLRKPEEEFDFSYLPTIEKKLVGSLLEFQKEGVCFGISKLGRILIADEMGLGKTLQALAIADYFKEDWPLLITTTASTRTSWSNHVKDYLPSVRCHNIVSLNSADFYLEDAKVVITSYSLMEKHVDKLLERNFGVLIFDESHNLKSFDAKRTKNAEKLAKNARRIILLSGTPALSKPVELYCQIKMIDKNFFPFKLFSQRYCDGKQTNFGWDSSGQSNLPELNAVLKKKFMIRRLKSDVLSQLREKNRETIFLNPDLIKLSEDVKKNFDDFEMKLTQGGQSKEILLSYYAKTAEIKAKAVCDYLKNLIKERKKFIIFAHHRTMMNAISSFLFSNKVDFIRIDGTTKNDLRDEYVKKFQTKDSCKIALLSLHACNAGITLTAADLVVFAELDWNPSTLAQAESRAHRIGQLNTVTCRYLLAEKTADTIIWKMLKDKQDVLKNAGLFSENLQNGAASAAPTSNEKLEKYFTPTKRKVDQFYRTENPCKSNEKEIEPKKIKLCVSLDHSNNAKDLEETSSKNIEKSNSVTSNNNHIKVDSKVNEQEIFKEPKVKILKSTNSDLDYLFNELDDADIPRTPAFVKNTENKNNDYEELFKDLEDEDFANLAF